MSRRGSRAIRCAWTERPSGRTTSLRGLVATCALVTTRPPRRHTTPAPALRPPDQTWTVTRPSSVATSASAVSSGSAASTGPLSHSHLELLGATAARDLQGYRRPNSLPAERAEDIPGFAHRLIVQCQQDVADEDPAALGRAVRLDVDHDQAAIGCRAEGSLQRCRQAHGLCRDAQPTTRDVSACQELRDDPCDGTDRDRERGCAGQARCVDPEHTPARLDQRSAREAVVHAEVEPQKAVDRSALPRSPLPAHGTHDPEASGHARAWAAERQDELADARRGV